MPPEVTMEHPAREPTGARHELMVRMPLPSGSIAATVHAPQAPLPHASCTLWSPACCLMKETRLWAGSASLRSYEAPLMDSIGC